MTVLDPRLNAHRPDLADAALAGRIDAPRFAAARLMQVVEPIVSVRKAPRFDAMQLTQALMGETVKLFAEEEGWAWVQLVRDGYVGYVDGNALSAAVVAPTHRVAVPQTFMYPEASLKSQPAVALPLNAEVTVKDGSGAYSRLANERFIFSAHLKPRGAFETDFVAVAEWFRHAPYYWGGKSVQGLDCSGLVQLALESCGIPVLRDSDMQERTAGEPLTANSRDGLQRGDLVFWNGHVGIMTGPDRLLHANGFHMMVAEEPLAEAVARISQQYGEVTRVRRLTR